jgi:hypothetical protein
MASLVLSFFVVGSTLAGCGDSTPDTPFVDAGSDTATIDGAPDAPDAPDGASATLDVVAASPSTFVGAAPVSVSANLTGSSAPIAWTLVGPGALSATTGPTTNYLPPGTGPIGVAVVTATAGPLSASARIVVSTAPQRAIVAYAWAHSPTVASYTPGGYSYDAYGGTITATRSSTGVYQMSFGGSNLAGGIVDVTAYGSSARCSVVGWGATSVDVTCTNGAGTPVDTRYVVRVTQPDVPSAASIVAFAHADDPTTASYTPKSATTYSAYAGPVTATRSATGTYTMTFGGADFFDGNVQVTAASSGRTCNVAQWNGGAIDVACFDATGAPADSRYVVSAVQKQVFSRTSVVAHAWANDPTSASYTPNAPYSYNAARQAIKATRSGVGTYAMTFDGLDLTRATVKVSAHQTARQCNVESWTGPTVDVRCYDGTGALADASYTLDVAADNQPVTTRVLAYAWASSLATASYAANPTYAYDPYGAITLARSAPGTYTATFAGLPAGAGSVMVSAYGSNRHCSVVDWAGTTVSIACLTPAGTLADSLYTVAIVANEKFSAASVAGYAIADQPTSAAYAPAKAFNSTNGAVSATRSAVGTYRVAFTGLTIESGDVQVAALEGARDCAVGSWGSDNVDVNCFDGTGAAADVAFSILVVLNRGGTPAANIVAYGAATQPSTASYTVTAPLAYDASGGAITATRSATGVYAMKFAGLELGRAAPKVTAAGNAGATCVVKGVTGDTVDVACTNAAGVGVDSTYALTLTQ